MMNQMNKFAMASTTYQLAYLQILALQHLLYGQIRFRMIRIQDDFHSMFAMSGARAPSNCYLQNIYVDSSLFVVPG